MEKKDIIVIGASAGGLDVLKRLFSDLPKKINASIFITWHMSADVRGVLPQILRQHSQLNIVNAEDSEQIEQNKVYIAPPDHHLLVTKGHVRVTKGPKENRFRPAIDPLFRSAAYTYGPRVVGVILSGALGDGTAGLWTIKYFGGTAVVQDPKESEVPSMPKSALREVQVDYKVSVAKIASLLMQLVEEPTDKTSPSGEEIEKTRNEIRVAMMEEQSGQRVLDIGSLTPFTCPDCHGVLSEIRDGDIVRFRCHTGHAFSGDTLLSMLSDSMESSIWNAIRAMEESIFLLNSIGDHYGSINQPKKSGQYFRKATEMEARSKKLRQSIIKNERLIKNEIEHEELKK